MLVDPETGRLTALSQAAVSANEAEEEVGEELFLQQIETSTPPCERSDELFDALQGGAPCGRRRQRPRRALARSPCRPRCCRMDDERITPTPRYLEIALAVRRAGAARARQCHAHARGGLLGRGGGAGGRPDPAVAAPADRAECQLAVLAGTRHRPRELAVPGVEPVAHGGGRGALRQPGGLPGGVGPADRLGRGSRPGHALLRRPTVRGLPDRGDPGGRRVHRCRGRRAGGGPGSRPRDDRRGRTSQRLSGGAISFGSRGGALRATASRPLSCIRSSCHWSRPERSSTPRSSTCARPSRKQVTSSSSGSPSTGWPRWGTAPPGSAGCSRRAGRWARSSRTSPTRTEESWG